MANAAKELTDRTIEITKIVTEVELTKGLKEKLTPQQRGAIVNAIVHMPWTLAEIRRRARAVMRANTWGTIGFDRWMDVEPIYSESEHLARAKELAEAIIEQRKIQWRDRRKATDTELAAAGLLDVAYEAQQEMDRLYEAKHTELLKRLKIVRRWLKSCDPTDADYVHKLLINKAANGRMNKINEVLEDVMHKAEFIFAPPATLATLPQFKDWRTLLPFFAPWLLHEVEELIAKRGEKWT